MNRTKVLETLDNLPSEFSVEELMDKLLFIDKVEFGIENEEEGRVISLDASKCRLKTSKMKMYFTIL